jgi:hypothetical protein
MKQRFIVVTLFLPTLLMLVGDGCVTKALWQNDELEACREPSSKTNLRLFQGHLPTDVLVVYDECSERNNFVHTRAYWLKENQHLVEQHVRPHFASVDASRKLAPMPLLYEPINTGTYMPIGLCAVVATNGQSFSLYADSQIIGSHSLPVYNDGKGRKEKIALTPLAVTADATIVGGFIAYLYLLAYSQQP